MAFTDYVNKKTERVSCSPADGLWPHYIGYTNILRPHLNVTSSCCCNLYPVAPDVTVLSFLNFSALTAICGLL